MSMLEKPALHIGTYVHSNYLQVIRFVKGEFTDFQESTVGKHKFFDERG